MVVDVEPVGKSSVALAFGCPGPDIGPLRLEGAVEAFYLAIRLRSIGLGEAVSGQLEGVGELVGPVAGTVVGEDPVHFEAVVGEEPSGPAPEFGGSGSLLVVEHFGVGQAGVVVHR